VLVKPVLAAGLLAVALPAGAAAGPADDFCRWLEGEWVRETKHGLATESWTRVSENTLEGEARVTSGENTKVTEYLRLERFGDELFYTAKPFQTPFPTAFLLVEEEGSRLVFDNPAHDFPQRIVYVRQEDDGLLVRIEGAVDGEEAFREFRFRREE
jgi:hypothetical protein